MANGDTVNAGDREALQSFVRSTQAMLREISTSGGPVGGPIFVPSEISPLMKDAWQPVNAELDTLYSSIETASDSSLIAHGLYGPQLTFKLAVVERLRQRFLKRLSLKWLKRLLKAIDNLFDSLAEALGIGAMAKEFKAAIEDLLEDLADSGE